MTRNFRPGGLSVIAVTLDSFLHLLKIEIVEQLAAACRAQITQPRRKTSFFSSLLASRRLTNHPLQET
jgi:hypothetical protein